MNAPSQAASDPRAPTAAINYFEWCSWAGIFDQSSPTCGGTRTGSWSRIVDQSSPTRGGTGTGYGNRNLFPIGNGNPFPTQIGNRNLFPTGNGNSFPTWIGNGNSFPTGNENPLPTRIGNKYSFPACLKCTRSKCTLKCTIRPFSNNTGREDQVSQKNKWMWRGTCANQRVECTIQN